MYLFMLLSYHHKMCDLTCAYSKFLSGLDMFCLNLNDIKGGNTVQPYECYYQIILCDLTCNFSKVRRIFPLNIDQCDLYYSSYLRVAWKIVLHWTVTAALHYILPYKYQSVRH